MAPRRPRAAAVAGVAVAVLGIGAIPVAIWATDNKSGPEHAPVTAAASPTTPATPSASPKTSEPISADGLILRIEESDAGALGRRASRLELNTSDPDDSRHTDTFTTDGTKRLSTMTTKDGRILSQYWGTIEADDTERWFSVDYDQNLWYSDRNDSPANWAEDLQQEVAELVTLANRVADPTNAALVELIGTETIGGNAVRHLRVDASLVRIDAALGEYAGNQLMDAVAGVDVWVEPVRGLPVQLAYILDLATLRSLDLTVEVDPTPVPLRDWLKADYSNMAPAIIGIEDCLDPLEAGETGQCTTPPGDLYTWLEPTKQNKALLYTTIPDDFRETTWEEAHGY
jgi:hypothetical protein